MEATPNNNLNLEIQNKSTFSMRANSMHKHMQAQTSNFPIKTHREKIKNN